MSIPDDAVAFARTQIGKPYVFGAAGPNSYDCSGLVVASYAHAGMPGLPHYTGSLIFKGTDVPKSQLQVGDLVFPDSGHVQLYSGNGKIIEAAHTGTNVREVNMWGFWRARRLAPGGGTSGGNTTGAIPVGTAASVVDFQTSVNNLTGSLKIFGALMFGTLMIILGLIVLKG